MLLYGNEWNVLAVKRHLNYGKLSFARYETTEGSCTVHVNCNLPKSFILLIIDHISLLKYTSSHIICIYIYFYCALFTLIVCIFTKFYNLSTGRDHFL